MICQRALGDIVLYSDPIDYTLHDCDILYDVLRYDRLRYGMKS